MATKSERVRAEEERAPHKTPAVAQPSAEAAREAVALRDARAAHERREKRDASLNLREQLVKGSPEARFRRSQAGASRIRGSS